MKKTSKLLTVLVIAVFAALGTNAAETKPAQPVDKAVEGKAAQPASTIPAQGTANGSKEDPQSWWRENCERIITDIKKMDGKVDIGFVGDSITARWGNGTPGWGEGENWKKHWGSYRAVNMGIGADMTQNVLWRLGKGGQLDSYKARLFVVMIGTNNCWANNVNPADVAAGIKAVIDLIQSKQPESKILLLSIFPTGDKPDLPGRKLRTSVNELISKFAGGPVHYMDISNKFLEPDGILSKEVMHDYLHLAPKGFDIWADSIKGKVKELLGEDKSEKKP